MAALRIALIVLAVCCAASGCDPRADRVSREDQKIMRTMVEIACKIDGERIIVSDQPAVPRESELHDTDGRNVQFGIDFDQRLAHEARWPRGQICPAVRVAADSTIESALADQPPSGRRWQTFSDEFGGARSLMRISLPVYSRDGRHAVVYTDGKCPYDCAAGFYHELEKTYQGWKIISSRHARAA